VGEGKDEVLGDVVLLLGPEECSRIGLPSRRVRRDVFGAVEERSRVVGLRSRAS